VRDVKLDMPQVWQPHSTLQMTLPATLKRLAPCGRSFVACRP
jgi:hypothetical protein